MSSPKNRKARRKEKQERYAELAKKHKAALQAAAVKKMLAARGLSEEIAKLSESEQLLEAGKSEEGDDMVRHPRLGNVVIELNSKGQRVITKQCRENGHVILGMSPDWGIPV